MREILKKFLPFWIFLIVFKFAACIHYNLMSPYGERVLPIWIVGLVVGGASLLQLILDVPAGFILDKYGYRKFLKITALLFMVAASFLLFGLNKYTYLISLFLGSFGWLFFGPGNNAYVLTHASKDNVGKFLSIKDTFESMGVVISSAFLIVTLSISVQSVAILILSFLLLSIIIISKAPKDIENVNKEKKISTHNYYIKRVYLNRVIKAIFKLNPASLILIITSLSASTFYAIIWFVVPLIIADHKNDMIMGLSLGSFDLGIMLTGFLIGKLADRFNKRRLVFLGLLIFSVAGIFLGFSYGLAFILLGFIATVGDEMASISLWAWLNTLDKDHDEDGLISGVINLFQDLGWTIGPIVAGLLYSKIGPEWTITVGGLLILMAWLIYSIRFSGLHPYTEISMALIPKKPHRFRHKR